MKFGTALFTALITGAFAKASLATDEIVQERRCSSDASVYLLGSSNSHHQKSISDSFNLRQAQYVLGDFLGLDRSLTIESPEDARAVASFRSKSNSDSFGTLDNDHINVKQSMLVVTVENFGEQNSHLLNSGPAFKIKNCADGEAVKKAIKSLASLIGSVTGKLEQSWTAGLRVFSDVNNHLERRLTADDMSMGDLDFDWNVPEEADFLKDMLNLLSFEQNLSPNEHVLLHLGSLKHLTGDKLETAQQMIVSSLRGLVQKKEFAKVAVIALANEDCVYEGDVLELHHARVGHKLAREHTSSSSSASSSFSSGSKIFPPFSTEEDCIAGTSACSGRGTCKKTSMGPYECVCASTYNSTKKQTTYWAGTACEKKDVSAETQLFLWTGVAIVVVLVWSTKLLFSISSDPLPGVLGATRAS